MANPLMNYNLEASQKRLLFAPPTPRIDMVKLNHFFRNVPFLNPLKTSEMGKISFHCKPCYQLKSTYLRFPLFRF